HVVGVGATKHGDVGHAGADHHLQHLGPLLGVEVGPARRQPSRELVPRPLVDPEVGPLVEPGEGLVTGSQLLLLLGCQVHRAPPAPWPVRPDRAQASTGAGPIETPLSNGAVAESGALGARLKQMISARPPCAFAAPSSRWPPPSPSWLLTTPST